MYEYRVRTIGDPVNFLADVEGLINGWAKNGWRLAVVTPGRYGIIGIFEREVVEQGTAEKTAESPQPKRKRKATT